MKKAKTNIFMHKDSALPWSQKSATIRNEQRRIAVRSSESEEANQAAFIEKLRTNSYTTKDLRRVNPANPRRRRDRPPPEGTVHYIDLPFPLRVGRWAALLWLAAPAMISFGCGSFLVRTQCS